MSSSLISLSFEDRAEDNVCSPGYSRAPGGIRVSSGVREREQERYREKHRKRERDGGTRVRAAGKQIEGHVQGSREEEWV